MRNVPLFTRAELSAAFRLIVSESEAQQLARQWFEDIAVDDVDESGRFLYTDWWNDSDASTSQVDVESRQSTGDMAVPNASSYEELRSLSPEEKRDFLLQLSDFHLTLVSLVSQDVARRIQHVRGQSDEAAERGRAQMRRIIEAMRGE